jgi:hypothetical protein
MYLRIAHPKKRKEAELVKSRAVKRPSKNPPLPLLLELRALEAYRKKKKLFFSFLITDGGISEIRNIAAAWLK